MTKYGWRWFRKKIIHSVVKKRVSDDLEIHAQNENGQQPSHAVLTHEAAFGYPRDFLSNQFVYVAISPRARGLSIGVNLNPVMKCNLDCLYCEVDRTKPPSASLFDIDRMAKELGETLELVQGGWLRQWPRYKNLPAELLEVRHVALSGDGEPTLSSHFVEAIRSVVNLRATGRRFKIVLLTNSTALDQPNAQAGLGLLESQDEVWAKFDGGTQEYFHRLNGSGVSLLKIMTNILLVARRRPVVIQSLFPAINGEEPPDFEIEEYARRLKELKQAGAEISLVQIYSANRPMARQGCSHLPLKTLSLIAQRVRRVTGLQAEVY